MRWLLLLLAVASTNAIQCPDGIGCTPCQPLPENEFEIQCSTPHSNSMFVVKFKPNEWVQIDCYDSPKWSEFHLGSIQQITKVSGIVFRMCELPEDIQLSAVVRQLVASNIDELVFQSYENLTLSLNRETLAEFRHIRRLTLTSNSLANVTSDLLHGFDNLTILNLRENQIRVLPGEFLNFPNLKAIELGSNRLEVLHPDVFSKLENLELLNIWNNRLNKIELGAFDNLKSLMSVDLHLNKLETLPSGLFAKLKNLRTINLSQNNFTAEQLPEDLLRNCSSLEIVTFFENRRNLTTLPNAFFANLTKLKMVKMKRNRLVYLPENLFQGATALKNVSLERNYIETLPKGIFKDCKELGTINLSFNELSTLPKGIFETLHKLEILDLSINHIETISAGFFDGLTSLQVLNMERNGLKVIAANALRPLRNLRIAKFSYNELTLKSQNSQRFDEEFGPKSAFHDCMSTMEELHLAYNNVTEIFGDWILGTKLKVLNLQHNKLHVLQVVDFQFISEKIRVDLSYNKVSNIFLKTAEAFAALQNHPKHILINVEHNPISCDCNLYDLLRYREDRMHSSVQDQFHIQMTNLRCAKPKGYKNIEVSSLRSKDLECLIEHPSTYNATCPTSCACYIRPENRAYIIDCSSKGYIEPPRTLIPPKGLHIELNLTSNQISKMADVSQDGYGLVTSLALAHNRISEVSVNSLSENLQFLDLAFNNISRLDTPVLNFLENSTNLTNLNLQSNPFVADCEARDFLSFIHSKMAKFPELQEVTFDDMTIPAFRMTPDELCPAMIAWIIGVCIGVALLGVIMGILAAVYYRYQQELKVWLYAKGWCLWFVTENELDKDKLYDAFISYSHKDEDFVVNTLIRKLEESPKPFKLCVHYRDWLAGEWIPTQIVRSVEDSRRTVIVLSPNFVQSEWGIMEFRTAHKQALSEGRARVIVILYGDVGNFNDLDPELQAYLSMNTYVKWGDPWFWQKLNYALPHQDTWVDRKKRKKMTIYETQQPEIQIIGDKKELMQHVMPSVTTT